MRDTKHFVDMLGERSIRPEWADSAVADPARVEDHPDGTRHYLKPIADHGNRWLRVVVNHRVDPPVRVTAFFDRRMRSPDQ
ncbi:MAG: DUF4258 domain-containing protein [Gemmatimonadota bacterium]